MSGYLELCKVHKHLFFYTLHIFNNYILLLELCKYVFELSLNSKILILKATLNN